MKNFFLSARPKQILKNTVVFIPLVFTMENWINNEYIEIQSMLINSVLSFLAFSCCSIIGYQINDFIDKNYDKKHPVKKNRPIVKGEISNFGLLFFVMILFIFGSFFSFLVNVYVFFLFYLYIIFSLFYTYKLKNLLVIDVLSVTVFYIIRMIGGAYSITFNISIWLYVLTFLSSIFIIFIKRTSEATNGNYRQQNIVIFYNNLSQNKIRIILLLLNIISYLTYSIVEIATNQRNFIFIVSGLFFSIGIIRYFYITKNNNSGESPETIVTKDIFLQILVCLFLVSIFWSEL